MTRVKAAHAAGGRQRQCVRRLPLSSSRALPPLSQPAGPLPKCGASVDARTLDNEPISAGRRWRGLSKALAKMLTTAKVPQMDPREHDSMTTGLSILVGIATLVLVILIGLIEVRVDRNDQKKGSRRTRLGV
jgi:hypothetical protein